MISKSTKVGLCTLAASLPVVLFSFSDGPLPRHTGAAVDGGRNCTACHAGAAPNSDARGKVTIEAAPYSPNTRQTIRVTVEHPEAQRWGFQLTARLVSDPSRMAGTFTPSTEVRVQCDPSGDAPCNGALEFASHRAVSTSPGRPNSRTWEIEWMPPTNDVGQVIFYAAGNAANGNFQPTGDRIYTTSLTVPVTGACTLTTRPTIQVVRDAASGGSTLGWNSLISIYGRDFGVPGLRREAGAGDLVNGGTKFPDALGCMAVEINGRRAPVLYVENGQINAQLPTMTDTGTMQLRVIANPGQTSELRSDPATITVARRAPAFFTFGDGRSVAARHPDFSIAADPSVVPGARPVDAGEFVLLYATGFGYTDPVFQAGEIVPRDMQPRLSGVTVTIGGVTVPATDVQYAGLTPGSISGLYQITVKVPHELIDGPMPIVATIDGVSTQSTARLTVRHVH